METGLQSGAATLGARLSDAGGVCKIGGDRLWKRRRLCHLGKRSAFPTFPSHADGEIAATRVILEEKNPRSLITHGLEIGGSTYLLRASVA